MNTNETKRDHASVVAAVEQEMNMTLAFAAAVREADQSEPGLSPSDIWDGLFDRLSPAQRAEAFFQLVAPCIDILAPKQQLTKEGKIWAVEVAEIMGPDWCQGVYNFGVAVARNV